MNFCEPLCPSCNGYLASKIGGLELSCTSCNMDFQLIQTNRIDRGLSNARRNMDNVSTKTEREYWVGFVGGIRWSLQKEREN